MADATLSSTMDSFLTEAALSIAEKDSLGLLNGWVYLGSATASASSQINVDNVVSTDYDLYQIHVNRVIPATDQTRLEIILRSATPANIGGTYKCGVLYAGINHSPVANTVADQTGTSGWTLVTVTGNAADEFVDGVFTVDLTTNSAPKTMWGFDININGATSARSLIYIGGYNSDTTAVAGFGIAFSGGNITSGTMKVYGLKNA